MRLLVVEDDPLLGDGLVRSLRDAAHTADWARDGVTAEHMLTQTDYDAMVLDLGLPGLDGLEVLRRLRKRGSGMPVLILTARDTLEDRVAGLDLGADDYLTKPFELAELEARLRAIVRRRQGSIEGVLQFGKVRYDMEGQRVSIDGVPLELSAREIGVFGLLAQRAGRVVSKEQLLDHLCGYGEEVYPNAIEVYVHRLRKKLESSGLEIRTVRGLGYLLEKPREG